MSDGEKMATTEVQFAITARINNKGPVVHIAYVNAKVTPEGSVAVCDINDEHGRYSFDLLLLIGEAIATSVPQIRALHFAKITQDSTGTTKDAGIMQKFQVRFTAPNSFRFALRAARKFTESLSAGIVLEQGENIAAAGPKRVVYVEVSGDRNQIEGVIRDLKDQDFEYEIKEFSEKGFRDACLNCENISDKPVTVCPNCSFREIAACPHCGGEVHRTAYLSTKEVNLCKCPKCSKYVRLGLADPTFNEKGDYRQPAITVLCGEGVKGD